MINNQNENQNMQAELRYSVVYMTPVEGWQVAAYNELTDARQWCDSKVADLDAFNHTDNGDHNDHHWYEVYDMSTSTEENPVGDLCYQTEYYYNE